MRDTDASVPTASASQLAASAATMAATNTVCLMALPSCEACHSLSEAPRPAGLKAAHEPRGRGRAARPPLRVLVLHDAAHGMGVVDQHDRLDAPGGRIEIEHVGAVEGHSRAVLQ